MKKVAIVVPSGQASIANIESTHQLFSHVNGILKASGRPALFDVKLVGLKNITIQPGERFSIKPDLLIDQAPKTDLIIIPAMIGKPVLVIAQNQAFIPWIQQEYLNGAEVASYCVGAFFLAATGLLQGRQCATHWFSAAEFRRLYPEVNLVDDKIITDDNGIYTSGGAFAYLNLLVHLIEKFAGREIAIQIAKSYMIDIDRQSQSPFIIFQGQKNHEDIQVKQAQNFIEANFRDKITTGQLATMFCVGRRSLERRFKKASSNTINEYIQRVEIEAAKKKFESSTETLSEVMFEVGYSDMKGFRTIFRKLTGISPAAYRMKYNKNIQSS